MNKEKVHTATAQSNIYINRHPEDIPYIGHNICCSDDRGRSNEHQKQVEGSTCSSHICTNSRFHTDFPDHSFYPVHQRENQTFAFPQGGGSTPQPMTGGSAFCSGSDDPDLIKDASCHSRRGDQLEMTASTNDDMNDNSEVPLRKAVLALHPQYFAKTSAAWMYRHLGHVFILSNQIIFSIQAHESRVHTVQSDFYFHSSTWITCSYCTIIKLWLCVNCVQSDNLNACSFCLIRHCVFRLILPIHKPWLCVHVVRSDSLALC